MLWIPASAGKTMECRCRSEERSDEEPQALLASSRCLSTSDGPTQGSGTPPPCLRIPPYADVCITRVSSWEKYASSPSGESRNQSHSISDALDSRPRIKCGAIFTGMTETLVSSARRAGVAERSPPEGMATAPARFAATDAPTPGTGARLPERPQRHRRSPARGRCPHPPKAQ